MTMTKAQRRRRRERKQNAKAQHPRREALVIEAVVPVTEAPIVSGFRVDETRRWYIFRTRPTWGARACKDLLSADIDAVLPRHSEIVIRRGKRKVRRIPLLPRTIFVGVRDHAQFAKALSHHGVDTVMRVNEAPAALAPSKLQAFLDNIAKAESHEPLGLKPGLGVKILAGPFASFPGLVVEVLPKDLVRVDVMLFGRVSQIEIHVADLETAC